MGWEADLPGDGLDFDDLVKKREEPKPQPIPFAASSVTKQDYNPFAAFGQTVESPASIFQKPTPKRPEGMAALADPQQYKEVAKGVPSGAVSFVGTTLQGAGAVPATAQANVQKNAQMRINVLDRLDRGEDLRPKGFGGLATGVADPESDAISFYRNFSPEQRAAERQKLQGQLSAYRPTPLAEQPLYKAGESVQAFGKTLLPAAPGYEDAFGRQVGEGLGSLIAGLPFGAAGRIPGTIFFGAGGMGEAGTRAIAYDQAEKRAGRPGLTQDQINTAALYGVGPGTTDMLPVEALLGRLHVPVPGRKALAQAIGRIGGQAFIEGMQEGGQQFLQNLIAKGIYKPDQALGEQVRENAEVGGAVGAAAEAAKEAGGSLWQRLLGRRGHVPGTRPDAGAGASDPFAQPLTPAPGGEGVSLAPAEPIDVTFEDLIPPERRLSGPQTEEPAPQAGLEPPPLPSPAPQAAPQVLPAAQAVEAAPVPPALRQSVMAETLRQVQAMPQVAGLLQAEQQRTGETVEQVFDRLVSAGPVAQPYRQAAANLAMTGQASRAAQPLVQALGAELAKPVEMREQFGGDTNAMTTRVAPSAQTEALGVPESLPMPSGSFSTQDVLYALGAAPQDSRDALGYTSKAVDAANALQRKSGPSTGFLNDLTKAGVTKNEMQATGLDRFLAERPTVTKQEIVDFLGQNRVGLKESFYAESRPLSLESESEDRTQRTYVDRNSGARYDMRQTSDGWTITAPNGETRTERYKDAALMALTEMADDANRAGEPKWREYSLDPDNPTYRESIIHLGGPFSPYNEFTDSLRAKYGDMPFSKMPLTDVERYTLDRVTSLAESGDESGGGYKSGHWSEPNIVAHIRTAEYQDTQGRKVLNLDELQSDWGQAVREGGARDEAKIAELRRKEQEAVDAYNAVVAKADWQFIETFSKAFAATGETLPGSVLNHRDKLRSEDPGAGARTRALGMNDLAVFLDDRNILPEESEKVTAAMREFTRASREVDLKRAELRTAESATPSHPLVNTTDQWVTTAMRRLIQQAADAGADGISITPAKIQNERFNLEQHVGEIAAMKQGLGYWVVLEDKQGQPLFRGRDGWSEHGGKTFSPEELRATIGKELADRAMANADAAPAGEYGRPLRGHDLRLGGEGMRATYDKLYPEILGKLLRKLDPSIKAEKTRLLPYGSSATDDLRGLSDYQGFLNDFTFFPLTEKAKQKLADEGQPMFALGAGGQAPDQGLIERAVQKFGLTRDPMEAGYILPDGRMLDFSGRHYGGGEWNPQTQRYEVKGRDYFSGRRDVDHRELDDLVDSGGGTERMHDFMQRTKAVRYMAQTGGFSADTRPTDAQLRVILRAHAQNFRGETMPVDWTSPRDDGYADVLKSEEISKPTLEKLRDFFSDDELSYALQGFYSPAIRATEKIKQDKATPEQWWSMISKTPGVRQEELQWMGLKEWLDEQKTPVYARNLTESDGSPQVLREGRSTIQKSEILDFMAQHQMELEDRLLGAAGAGGPGVTQEEIEERAREIQDKLIDEMMMEAQDEWHKANDPERYEIEINEDNGLSPEEQKVWDKATVNYQGAKRFFDDYLRQQYPIPEIGHAVRAPKLADFLPPDFTPAYDVPKYFYDLEHPGERPSLRNNGPYDTEEEAREAAQERLEELKEEFERESENWETPDYIYHEAWGQAMRQAREELGDPDDAEGGGVMFRQYAIKGGTEYSEVLVRFPELKGRYRSAHYSDQELVHIRFDTREGPKGDRVLFIHEIQSDLHQRSRGFGFGKEGYAKAEQVRRNQGFEGDEAERRGALQQEYIAASESVLALDPDRQEADFLAAKARADAAASEIKKLTDKANQRLDAASRYITTFRTQGAPEAPYTGNAWWELGFKRMVQYAVENNFDAIALTTPGQIHEASFTPVAVAQKFYGENLPRFIEKYLKKWGVKPSKEALSGTQAQIEWRRPENLSQASAIDYYSRIREALRAAANQGGYEEAAVSGIGGLDSIIADLQQIPDAEIGNAIERSSVALAWAKQGKPGRVESLYQQVRTGENPYYRITDAMRDDVQSGGQPLALGPASPKSDVKARLNIGGMVKAGRTVTVPYADAVLDVAKPYLPMLPQGIPVAALNKVAPVPGRKGWVIASFKTHEGQTLELEGPYQDLATRRAWFGGDGLGGRAVFLPRFNAVGSGDPLVIGEMRHEAIHALRQAASLPGEVWGRLLDHAKQLRLLDSDFKTYLQRIGSPNAKDAPDGVTILSLYEDAYNNHRNYQESIDQEYVAHLAELYSHGELLPQEVAPVKDILEDIFAGKYSKSPAKQSEITEAAAFAGPWAKTAKQNPLIQAQKLAENGVDPETIWKRTGWFQGADDRWRFEIDDSLASIKFDDKIISGGVGTFRTTLGAFLDHPGLFKAYPFMRGLPVFLTTHMITGEAGHRGVSNGESPEGMPPAWITVGVRGYKPQDRQKVLSALLHEVQHDIQDIENFAAGGNLKGYADGFLNRLFDGQLTDFDQRLIRSDRVNPDYRAWMAFAKNSALKPDDQELRDGLTYFTSRLSQSVAFEAYQRLAGEVESREVQNRLEMTPAERREKFPAPVGKDEQRVKMSWPDARYADDMLALAGPRAAGAPRGAFATAERREAQGRTPDQIWQELGVTRGPETKWRWEIDDSAAKIIGLDKVFDKPSPGLMQRLLGRTAKTGNVKTAINVPLLNVLNHPKLYTAYPFLRQMRVDLAYGPGVEPGGMLRTRETASGGKVYRPIKASASSPDELKTVLLHEIQHYIQNREGFATGSDMPGRPDYQRPRVAEEAQATALYDPARDSRKSERFAGLTSGIMSPTHAEGLAVDIMDLFEKLDAAKASGASKEDISELEGKLLARGRLLEDAMLVRPEDYVRSAGEAEAREVESRMDMTTAERRATRPLADLPDDAIVSRDTQTRDYRKAYDTIMERAKIWKQISDRWKTAEDIGAGVSVVRPTENSLIYAQSPNAPLVDFQLYPEVGSATPMMDFHPAFTELPFAQQKQAMDAILKDLRARNLRPAIDQASDESFAFWARYDPRMVAFDPRLYAKEVEALAKAEYGEDATVSYDDYYGEYAVTSPEMKLEAERAAIEAGKVDKQIGQFLQQLRKKYGDDYHERKTPEEAARLDDLRYKLQELMREADQGSVPFDDTAIFEGRTAHWRGSDMPVGVDPDIYKDLIIDEQLDRWGKLPRPGDDVDFSDLLPA